MNAPSLDPQALLAALVLAPATYSRNRFFQLYADPEVRKVRRRAHQLRSVVRDLATLSLPHRGAVLAVSELSPRQIWLSYERSDLGLKRRVLLEPLELALVRVALGPRGATLVDGLPGPSPEDALQVEQALMRLARVDPEAPAG